MFADNGALGGFWFWVFHWTKSSVLNNGALGGGAGQLVPMIWCIGAQTSQLSKPLQKRVTNKNFDTILNHLKGHLQVHVCIAKVCFAQCSTRRLALGSHGCCCCSFGRHHAQNIFENLILLYFWKARGPTTSKLIFPTVKYTNTNTIYTNIYKYKYSLWRSARNTKHLLYF